jgi:hypothetical protein
MADYNFAGSEPLPFVAGGTIVKNRVVVLDSTEGQVVAGSAIAGVGLGCSLNAAVAGEQVKVQTMGIAKLTASAAITLGAEVMVTASGAGKVSTASGATARAIGVALQAAGADGDIISVLVCLPAVTGPATS